MGENQEMLSSGACLTAKRVASREMPLDIQGSGLFIEEGESKNGPYGFPLKESQFVLHRQEDYGFRCLNERGCSSN